MKLKNSHILLIAMSIFLLISIGSVCASDAAMDADAQLADAESNNVVLANDTPTEVENTTQKIDTSVVSNDVTINEGESAELNVNVKDNESNDVNFTKNEIKINEGNKTINFNYANSSLIITDKLSAGNHSLIINYLGNANYTNSSTKILLSIIGKKALDVPESVNVNGTKIAAIPIKLTDSVNYFDANKENISLIVYYKDGNDTLNKSISEFELENGKITFLYDLNATTSTLAITYIEGNETLNKNVTLKRVNNAKIVPINLEAEYASGAFTFKLVDTDTNETLGNKKLSYTIITGTVNTAGSITTNADGIATLDNTNINVYKYYNGTISNVRHLSVGKQAFSIKGDDSTISAPEIKNNFTITKATIKIAITPYKEYYGSTKKFVVTVTNVATGDPVKGIVLHINIPNTTGKNFYFLTDENGTIQVNVTGLPGGTYKLTVSNNDTVNMTYKNVSGTITIVKIAAKLKVSAKTIYYNSGTTATVKLTNKKTGKGIANVYILIQFGTGKKSTYYMVPTNKKGEASFSVPLGVGKHKMTVNVVSNIYEAKKASTTITVKKASAKITAPKTTAYYKQGKYFTVKVTNTKNKKPIYYAKVNIKVFVSKTRAYSYTGTTGPNGKVSLKINYKPGTYKVVVSPADSKNYTAKSITSKITVKKAPAKLITKKLTAKKGEKKYFKVTVKNKKTKKVISGVKVKIKVYTGKSSKTYTVKTSSKGIAKLNVKSLKVGKHKVVVTSANKYVTAKTAKSSIKITKK